MKMEKTVCYRQCVPKRRHIKFRPRGITQQKEYNIHNTAKFLNQEIVFCYKDLQSNSTRSICMNFCHRQIII